MFVRIGNTPRDYAWGSTTAIANLLGTEPSGEPEAELWLGAHPGSPSRILDPAETGGATDLADWLARDAPAALGPGRTRLPYLLKVLAAEGPLSLQAHPSAAQARAGFDREEAAGIPADSADRNYKDPYPKPELIFALSDPFDALCGFRDPAVTASMLTGLAAAADDEHRGPIESFARSLAGEPSAALRRATEWLLGGEKEVGDLLDAVLRAAQAPAPDAPAEVRRAAQTATMLAEAYPGDPGVVLALLLNRVALRPGEVLYLPAGNIHAYLHGLGIELMTASDNVLRGGLTPKRIDVPELVGVLDFSPIEATPLAAEHPAPGVEVFRPDVPDFALEHVALDERVQEATLPLPGASIALCTAGTLEVSGAAAGADSVVRLIRGDAVFATPDERELTIRGEGTLFLATPNG